MGASTKDKGPRKLDEYAQNSYKEQSAIQAMAAKDKVATADAKQLNARDQNQMFNFALPNMMQQNFVMQKMGKDFNYDMAKMGVSNENAINLLGLQALLGNKTYQPTSGGTVAPNYSVMPASTQPTSTNTEAFPRRKFTINTGSTSWTP